MDFALTFLRDLGRGVFYLSPIFVALALMIVFLGLFIGRREGWSRSDAIYYAFITATTVGYGDFRPRKMAPKFVAIIIALLGLVMTGILVAIGLWAVESAHKATSDPEQVIMDLQKEIEEQKARLNQNIPPNE